MDGCVRRQLSAGEEVRRRWRRSGFAAALVDVVLHQGDDLLQLVVQLGATRRGVGLQSAHHLKGKTGVKTKTKKKKRLLGNWCVRAVKSATWPDAERLSWRGKKKQQQPLLFRPFDTLPSTRQKTPSRIYKKKPTSALLFTPNSCHTRQRGFTGS